MYCSHVLNNVVPRNSTVHTVRTFLIVAQLAPCRVPVSAHSTVPLASLESSGCLANQRLLNPAENRQKVDLQASLGKSHLSSFG